jgi:hypothetical protein
MSSMDTRLKQTNLRRVDIGVPKHKLKVSEEL